MPTPVIWSGPTLVNTTTDGDQYISSVTALEGGGYVVCWSGQLTVGINSDKTNFQIYDAGGNKVGGEIVADTPTNSQMPKIAGLPGGGFVITHTSADAPGSWGVHAQIFDSSGAPTTDLLAVSGEDNPPLPQEQTEPEVTALSTGGFAVTYFYHEPDGSRSIRLQRFDATGNKDGGEIYVAHDPDGFVSDLTIQQTGDGYFAIAWGAGTGGDRNVIMQVFNNDGTPQTGIAPITGSDAQWKPQIAYDGAGNFIVIYESDPSQEAMAQIFSADGTQIKAEFLVSDPDKNQPFPTASKAIGLPGGGFFVVWKEWDGSTASLVGQVLDGSGNKVGAETLIYDSPNVGDNFSPTGVALLGDGRIVVSLDGTFTAGDDVGTYSVHTIIVDTRGVVIDGTDEDDILLGSVGNLANTITAKDGHDEVYGLGGDDTIFGNDGNDTIDGGTGADSMVGGAGNDFYVMSSLSDVIVEAASGGTDTILVEGFDYTLAGGLEIEVLEMDGNTDADLTGNDLAQWLKGDGSNNKLMGMGGNDTLEGGANFDYLEGGSGDDLYVVDLDFEIIVEQFDEGTDTVKTEGISFSLETRANVEHLILGGAGGNTGTGNELANMLTGNGDDNELFGLAGNDTLIGMGGTDKMHGGIDDDTYEVVDAADIVDEKSSQGTDTVNASIDYTLTDDVENLTLKGSAAAGTGNDLDNVIVGNGLANVLIGLGGDDTLDGQGGADKMAGGERDDTYVVDDVGDAVTEAFDEGIDTVVAKLDYTLGDHLEYLTLEAGTAATGNDLANAITGNDGANVIDGKAGNDTMTGLAGNDVYVVADAGDEVVEASNGGIDTVQAAFDYALGANVENLVLTGTAAKGKGNDLANTLAGNSSANTLSGGTGNDTIDGGAGKDQLEGGKGSDTYVLGSANDTIADISGTDDTVTSTISRSLGAYAGIENLTLAGTGNINGEGTAKANDLNGNSGKNKLKGLDGNDLLRGLGGADQLWGGNGKDSFDFDKLSEIGKSSGKRDIIRDFKHLTDKIDLKSIDANALAGGNNAFKFVAAEGSTFSGVTGQLIWDQVDKAGTSKDVTLISGDINGDKVADFTLELSGLVTLTKGDFIL